MPHRFVHIGINFGEAAKVQELEPAIQAVADDWIRYAPNNWIVWTASSNANLAAALRRNLTINDQFMLFEINPLNRDGWHHGWVWEWLDRVRVPPLVPAPAIDWAALLQPPATKP